MSDRQRLFFGVALPEEVVEALAPLIAAVSDIPGARPTAPENLHFTLKFLGWVAGNDVEAIESLGASAASASPPSSVCLTRIGAFPRTRRARVVWVGVEDSEGTMAALAARLDRGAADLGVEREERSFTPHLTLARLKKPAPLPDLPEVPERARTAFGVNELILYRSHLSPKGARYEIARTFPLG